jgi:hypothetical protein
MKLKKITKMKRSPMLMDWENQHSKNSYTIKSNLHVQFNSHQNPKDKHCRDWKINPKFHQEAQMTVNSQGNTEQSEKHWRNHNTLLQTMLQKNSKKKPMVLAEKHTWRPVEQNRRPRQESMQLCSLIFDKGTKSILWWKDSLFNKCCWENCILASRKLEIHVFNPVQVSTQSGLRTFISDLKPWR